MSLLARPLLIQLIVIAKWLLLWSVCTECCADACSLISYLYPARNRELLEALQQKRMTAVSMDMIPRTISRAQSFDSLSSQANIAGYRAVIEAGPSLAVLCHHAAVAVRSYSSIYDVHLSTVRVMLLARGVLQWALSHGLTADN